MSSVICCQPLYVCCGSVQRQDEVCVQTGWWSEIPWVTLLYRPSNKWWRLNNSVPDTESDLAIIAMYLWGFLLLQRGKQSTCILVLWAKCKVVRNEPSRGKEGMGWRENNDGEHGEGGPPQSVCSYLCQASPPQGFFPGKLTHFYPCTVNAFPPPAHIIHSCPSFHILHIRTVVRLGGTS